MEKTNKKRDQKAFVKKTKSEANHLKKAET